MTFEEFLNGYTPRTVLEIRTSTGLSQRKFAEKYGMSYRTIQSWEGGQREAPLYLIALLDYAVTNR